MDTQRPDPEPTPSPSLRSQVDISSAIADARRAAASATPEDGPYGELMANYVEWGELLEQWNRGEFDGTDEQFEGACRDHLDYSVTLGAQHERHFEQRWAVFVARMEGRWRATGGRD
jgi:hypothetical protein